MSAVAARLVGARVRLALVGVAVVLALLAFVLVGRWEGRRNADRQNARMAAIYRLATSDGLVSPRLDLYRLAWQFDCLDYSPRGRPTWTAAFELCFDASGRLVETIDRRTDPPHFASLVEDPSRATLRVPIRRLVHAFAVAGAFRHMAFGGELNRLTALPVRFNDIGSQPRAKPKKTKAP